MNHVRGDVVDICRSPSWWRRQHADRLPLIVIEVGVDVAAELDRVLELREV